MTVALVGAERTRRDLRTIAARMRNLGPVAAETEMHAFEERERRLFASFHGYDVDTGALEASLTGQSADSIREIHGDELVFGTSVPYAIYHPEALIRLDETSGIARGLLRRIMEGVG